MRTTLWQRILRWPRISEKYVSFVAAIFIQNVKEQTDDHLDFLLHCTFTATN